VLVIGALQALVTYLIAFFRQRDAPLVFHDLRQKVGKSILLGLELLVAAEIIRSVAIDPRWANSTWQISASLHPCTGYIGYPFEKSVA
jgi:uncharacterized membrane protein